MLQPTFGGGGIRVQGCQGSSKRLFFLFFFYWGEGSLSLEHVMLCYVVLIPVTYPALPDLTSLLPHLTSVTAIHPRPA